jgi:hypothetical protein
MTAPTGLLALKVCPFCGSGFYGGASEYRTVLCANSKCPIYELEMSFDDWQTRSPSADALVQALEELVAAMTAEYPSAEQGQQAQTNWCNRKADALDKAGSALAAHRRMK